MAQRAAYTWTYGRARVMIESSGLRGTVGTRRAEPLSECATDVNSAQLTDRLTKYGTMEQHKGNVAFAPKRVFRAPIWDLNARSRGQVVRRVCAALEREYGLPRHGNPEVPLDDLISIIVSNKTGPSTAGAVYAKLKAHFGTWDDILVRPPSSLEKILRPAGLSRVKSSQIRATLRRIRADFASCNLDGLRRLAPSEAQSYLTSLAGVSDKVAKCVLMYTCGAEVLPVDSHVHRIAARLGWTVRKRADQCHEELEALVPPHRRYAFHVDCIAHGRLICRPANPNCPKCCVKRHCYYYRHEVE